MHTKNNSRAMFRSRLCESISLDLTPQSKQIVHSEAMQDLSLIRRMLPRSSIKACADLLIQALDPLRVQIVQRTEIQDVIDSLHDGGVGLGK